LEIYQNEYTYDARTPERQTESVGYIFVCSEFIIFLFLHLAMWKCILQCAARKF